MKALIFSAMMAAILISATLIADDRMGQSAVVAGVG